MPGPHARLGSERRICSLVLMLMVGSKVGTAHATPLAPLAERPSKLAIEKLTGLDIAPEQTIERISAEAYLAQNPSPVHAQQQPYETLMKSLGFLPKDYSIEKARAQIMKGAAAGVYSPKTKKLYVMEGWRPAQVLGALQEPVTVAHEFVHAAQDRHMDLAARRKQVGMEEDEGSAFSLAGEGQAMVLGLRIGMVPLLAVASAGLGALLVDPAVALTLSSPSQWLTERTTAASLDANIPPWERDFAIVRYFDGGRFAWFVEGAWGREGHLALVCNPPRSTEQILHPDKYLQGEDPPLHVALPQDAPVVFSTGMGEWNLRWLLAQSVDSKTAITAAEGWGGDRAALLQDGSVVWRLVMDSEEDARELERVLPRALGAPKRRVQMQTLGKEVQVHIQEEDVPAETFARWREGTVGQLEAPSAWPKESRCWERLNAGKAGAP